MWTSVTLQIMELVFQHVEGYTPNLHPYFDFLLIVVATTALVCNISSSLIRTSNLSYLFKKQTNKQTISSANIFLNEF